MKINIKRIAKLANLNITADEEKLFEKQLSSTLDTINELNETDTKGVEPTSQVTGLINVTKSDAPLLSSFSQNEALANAKNTHNGFFKVEAILENE